MPTPTHPQSFHSIVRHIPSHSIVRHPPTGVIGMLVHNPPPPPRHQSPPTPTFYINRHETVEVLMTSTVLALRWVAENV